jgi:hypothetical protein
MSSKNKQNASSHFGDKDKITNAKGEQWLTSFINVPNHFMERLQRRGSASGRCCCRYLEPYKHCI